MAIDHPVGINVKVEVRWNPPTWSDISSDVRFLEMRSSQRSRLQQTYDPGSLRMVLDNSARKYDPLYTSGTFFGNLKPGKDVRITFDSASAAATEVWYGRTDRFLIDYDQSNRDSTVTLTCEDALAAAARAVIPAGVGMAAYAGADAGTAMFFRFGSLNFQAGSPIDTLITDGYTPVDVATYAPWSEWDETRSHNFLDEMRALSDLEVAPITSAVTSFSLVQHDRHWFKKRSGSANIQTTLGTGGLPFYSVTPLFDADELITAVSMTDYQGNAVIAIDAAGVTAYGTRYPAATYNGLPSQFDEVLEGAANTMLSLRATEEFRLDEVVVKPGSDTGWRQYTIELGLLDRITVNFTPTYTGSALALDYFIDGVTHQISPGDWTTVYSLMPANRYDTALPGDLFVVGSSLVGGSDLVGF
jgi:hypothetical protein